MIVGDSRNGMASSRIDLACIIGAPGRHALPFTEGVDDLEVVVLAAVPTMFVGVGVGAFDHGLAFLVVAEDEEHLAAGIRYNLTAEGYRVTIVGDGPSALRTIKENPGGIDLIILDLMLPGMDGYEVLQHLKSDPKTRHIPVLMISALDEMDSVVRCIELGAEDYLPKPFDPVLLNARIGASLEKKRLRDRDAQHVKELAEWNQTLEERVAERSAAAERHADEAQQAKVSLEEQNKRLRELYQTARQFVDTVSHEFRTPLTVIREYASALNDGLTGETNETQREYLLTIMNRVDDMSTMVNDLLDVSRIEADLLRTSRRSSLVSEIIDAVPRLTVLADHYIMPAA